MDNLLAEVAKEVTLVHRRGKFRGALDSVEKVENLAASGKIDLLINSEITSLKGENTLEQVKIFKKLKDEEVVKAVDYFIPLFGLSPKLGPLKEWGLDLNKESIPVNTVDYSTSIPGIYAIGDINDYVGKLRLILCGFHEATIMVQSAYRRIHPDKNLVLKYTTVSGVNAFE